jgi:hypothetical protein
MEFHTHPAACIEALISINNAVSGHNCWLIAMVEPGYMFCSWISQKLLSESCGMRSKPLILPFPGPKGARLLVAVPVP